MNGTPILRIALVLLALAAVLLPVLRITLDSPVSKAEPPTTKEKAVAPGATRRATLLLRAAPPPLRCSVSQHGIDLLHGEEIAKNLHSTGEGRAAVDLAPGEDLVIRATWGNDESHALGIEVQTEDASPPLEKTFWSRHTLEDVLPLPEAFTP